MIVPLFRSLSELSQSYEDVSVIYRKLEQLVLKWTCNKQMWIKETMIFLKVLTERNCRKTENKLKMQSVVLLPLIPNKIIYTRCISPISSKRTLRSSCSDLVHAQWDPQTGNQRSPPGLQVAWSGQTRPDATFRLVKKKNVRLWPVKEWLTTSGKQKIRKVCMRIHVTAVMPLRCDSDKNRTPCDS